MHDAVSGIFFKNTCCRVTRQKYVGYILRGWGGTPCYPLPHLLLPVSRLPPSCLHPPPLASRLLSLASCLLSFVSPLHHPLPLYPSPTETLIAGGWEKLTAGGIEDDQHVGITSRWAERGEFDLQKRGRMTAGQRRANLTSRRGGGLPLGGEGRI